MDCRALPAANSHTAYAGRVTDESCETKPGEPGSPSSAGLDPTSLKEWEVGDLIGSRYVLERKLGRGAMGDVYLARDYLLNKHVALKVLRAELAENRTTVRRFLREVALAHSVTHPHVVRIYDTGEKDGLPYFSMELLQGQTLDELVQQHGAASDGRRSTNEGSRLAIEEIRSIACEVLEAMEAAHQVGVVHRDLKPANVMLTHRGAIVMDFGVAGIETAVESPSISVANGDARSLVRTEAGTVFGSPAYMAPELWEGAPASIQSDIYAFGVMLYQMLSGKLPVEAPTPSAFLEKLRSERPISVRTLRRGTPWNLALLVDRCMNPDPDVRPASAAAAAALIRPLRGHAGRIAAVTMLVAGGIAAAGLLLRPGPIHERMGLDDANAMTDLAAAVRCYDLGDRHTALRHLERLAVIAPRSASAAFLRATLFHELGDGSARVTACEGRPAWNGDERWRELAEYACGPSYELAPALLGTLENTPGAMDAGMSSFAVVTSLVPRVEMMREQSHPVIAQAHRMIESLAERNDDAIWRLPTRRESAGVDLELALGNLPRARELADELANRHPEAPLLLAQAGWLALFTGDLERARALAVVLAQDAPELAFRLDLESGRLEHARHQLDEFHADPAHARLLAMWCGYAYRFEIERVPEHCRTLEPGLLHVLWAAGTERESDRLNMNPVEETISRRQHERNIGDCRAPDPLLPIISHVAPPFETYLTQLEISSGLCADDMDLSAIRDLARRLTSATPADPWALLLTAQVDDALGDAQAAHERRLHAAKRWRNADAELPLVQRLRQKLGIAGTGAVGSP